MLAPCLAYSSTLKIEESYYFETSVDFELLAWRYMLEDRLLPNYSCEKLKYYAVFTFVLNISQNILHV
jgi:hypothetical protein